MEIALLLEKFRALYGEGEMRLYFAPGRVNLIGEHTDYNGGYVLPCALSFGTYLVVRKTGRKHIRFASQNFPFSAEIPMEKLSEKQGREWVNYPLGVMGQFFKKNLEIPGMDLLFAGNIPNGAGLSSSASIEMVTAFAVDEIIGSSIERVQLIKMCRAAENEFVGMNCGIMDQFVVGMGEKDAAVFLNCRTLDFELVPLKLKNYSIVISNTNKRRELAESKYNERVAECSSALRMLGKARELADLSDLSMQEFNSVESLIAEDTIRKRARHVISENDRVLLAIDALKSGDLILLGKLMNQSHQSLKEDYEVTGKELDTIVAIAQSVEGVLGSRMTGAGFGGCSVSIVRNDRIQDFIAKVGEEYKQLTGLTPDFYIASTGNGPCRLQ